MLKAGDYFGNFPIKLTHIIYTYSGPNIVQDRAIKGHITTIVAIHGTQARIYVEPSSQEFH